MERLPATASMALIQNSVSSMAPCRVARSLVNAYTSKLNAACIAAHNPRYPIEVAAASLGTVSLLVPIGARVLPRILYEAARIVISSDVNWTRRTNESVLGIIVKARALPSTVSFISSKLFNPHTLKCNKKRVTQLFIFDNHTRVTV